MTGFRRMFFAIFVLIFAQSAFSVDSFSIPLEQIVVLRAEHVVSFRTIGYARDFSGAEDFKRLEVELRTRAGVRLFTKGVKFVVVDASGFPKPLEVTANPAPVQQFDKWYKEERAFYVAGTVFTLESPVALARDQQIKITFEACNEKTCLMPSTFSLSVEAGALGVLVDEPQTEKSATPQPTPALTPTLAPLSTPVSAPISVSESTPTVSSTPAPAAASAPSLVASSAASSTIESRISETVRVGGIWLLPLLFLAGLMMNLTPCVYPMIPITLSVLSRFGKSGGVLSRWFPAIFVLGVALSYSVMGLVAGLSGSVFGTILQSGWVSGGVSLLMFLFGLMMLGVFDISKLQAWGSSIPLSKQHPAGAVLVMGAVSGLVSAPCTGPVLATLLLLVSQTQDALRGFVLLFVFALGFGAPYLVLGSLVHRARRLPNLGYFEELVKIAFAALMFALAAYYSKQFLFKFEYVRWFFERPNVLWIGILLLTALIFITTSRVLSKESVARNAKLRACSAGAFRLLSVIPLTIIALWLTLFSLNSFPSQEFAVKWETSWDGAVSRARSEGKPLVVDVWADWCAACKEMDANLWNRSDIALTLNTQFVPLKLDFTEESEESKRLAKAWNLGGLPAIGLYSSGDNFSMPPKKLFREKVDHLVLAEALAEIIGEKR